MRPGPFAGSGLLLTLPSAACPSSAPLFLEKKEHFSSPPVARRRFCRPFPSPVSSVARRGAARPTRHAARPVRPPRRRPRFRRPFPSPISFAAWPAGPRGTRHAQSAAAAFHGRRNVTAICESCRRAEASPALSPSPLGTSSDGNSDSDHHDPEDSFYSASGGSGGDHQDSSYNDEQEEEEEEENHDEEEEEMSELEKEYRTLQANHENILETLKQHRDDDVSRGQAVKNQKALWDKTLEMRFLLQKAFSTSNKLPKEPVKSMFCQHNQEVEQAYFDLLNSSKQTLGCMLELQEALLERNHTAKDVIDTEISSDSNGENDEWSGVQKSQRRITLFRNSEIDKWQRKTQVTTGAAALKGKLHAFNQNISDQVASYMRDPSRMINRMYLRKSTLGVFGEEVGELGNTKEEQNTEGDPELIDDSEFYHQLLKEFLESCDAGASESAFYALRKQQHKKRKLVDRRASKSRKIRYHVHEKIANFMAPVPMAVPPMAPKLFENLFGMGSQKPTTGR